MWNVLARSELFAVTCLQMQRVIAISDLHIGGDASPMLGHPERLTGFLEELAAFKPNEGEELELVIHGDVIDFLAEKPNSAWTLDEADAVRKLENVFRRVPAIFNALGRCMNCLPRCTILLGNHDVELAYPRVRDALFRHLQTTPHRCRLIYTNECYRVGDLLIEHGNRYDSWNTVDYNGLREIVSFASRGEKSPWPMQVSPGSRLVHEVINPLKERYDFIDLLKPEDKVVALLLTTLEPKLKRYLEIVFAAASQFAGMLNNELSMRLSGNFPAPGGRKFVSIAPTTPVEELPPSIAEAFKEELREAASNRRTPASNQKNMAPFLDNDTTSLRAMLLRGEIIEPARLRKLQVGLRNVLQGDLSFDEGNASDRYAEQARRMIARESAKVVVMGHTHLRRDVSLSGGRYVNTGTWADMIRVDDGLLEDNDTARVLLVEWLKRLVNKDTADCRICSPSYADVTISDEGQVVERTRPMLRIYDETTSFR